MVFKKKYRWECYLPMFHTLTDGELEDIDRIRAVNKNPLRGEPHDIPMEVRGKAFALLPHKTPSGKWVWLRWVPVIYRRNTGASVGIKGLRWRVRAWGLTPRCNYVIMTIRRHPLDGGKIDYLCNESATWRLRHYLGDGLYSKIVHFYCEKHARPKYNEIAARCPRDILFNEWKKLEE